MTGKPQISENTSVVLPITIQLKLIGSIAAVVAAAMLYITSVFNDFKNETSKLNRKITYLELIVYSQGKVDPVEVKKMRDDDINGSTTRGGETQHSQNYHHEKQTL
jgi:hypothetical protein